MHSNFIPYITDKANPQKNDQPTPNQPQNYTGGRNEAVIYRRGRTGVGNHAYCKERGWVRCDTEINNGITQTLPSHEKICCYLSQRFHLSSGEEESWWGMLNSNNRKGTDLLLTLKESLHVNFALLLFLFLGCFATAKVLPWSRISDCIYLHTFFFIKMPVSSTLTLSMRFPCMSKIRVLNHFYV